MGGTVLLEVDQSVVEGDRLRKVRQRQFRGILRFLFEVFRRQPRQPR